MNRIQLVARSIQFPEARDIDINMMPFVIGDAASLPSEYRHYWDLIRRCDIEPSENGRIGFLSIQESEVEPGKSQRRPGIHTDGHGFAGAWGGWGGGTPSASRRAGRSGHSTVIAPHAPHAPSRRLQGIYLASNTSNSCRVWDMHIVAPGPMGDCEPLRPLLSRVASLVLLPNCIYWITDAVPHEALPSATGGYRQWFRVVTSPVSKWYAAHSTPNRLGVVPAGTTTIVEGNKFRRPHPPEGR